MIYRWKSGRNAGVPAQVAGDRIEHIREEKGVVRPIDVVDDARPHSSPLHRCFEWRDDVAAEKWRIEEARHLLSALVIVPAEAPDSTPVRAFIAIGPSNEANDFMPLAMVMSDDDLRKRALAAALEDFRQLRARYAQLKELSAVWDAVDAVDKTALVA